MIELDIKFKNFANREVTEKYFFHLSLVEIADIELRGEEGLEDRFRTAMRTKNGAAVLDLLRDLMLISVGRQSADGRKFIKNDEIREDFEQTGAYSALFVQLATGELDAVKFFTGVMPADLHEKAAVMKARVAEMDAAEKQKILDGLDDKARARLSETMFGPTDTAANVEAVVATSTKPIDAYTLEELLDLPDEEYLALSKRHEHNKPKALILAGRYRNK